VLVVLLALVVAAADQVVTTRRSVAALTALGVEPALHRRVLARQLTVLSLPAALAGCAVGLFLHGSAGLLEGGPRAVAWLLAPLPLTALLVVAAARVAVALVAGPLRAAADPAGLRAP
jgi:predicted lysophospholipase L1 biosynthesis ABC-type transport system permease subunit